MSLKRKFGKFLTHKKIFVTCLVIIVFVGFLLRIIPTFGNNFYFTIDQADEATLAREFWYRHQIPIVGQGSSIEGLYHGPLFIVFISIGYVLFMGHPFGALFMLILLNITTLAILVLKVASKISLFSGLLLAVGFQVFWPFFDASRFAFSPFPLVPLTIIAFLLLIDCLDTKPSRYILAAIPIALVFHMELASLPPLVALYLLTGSWAVFKKRISYQTLLLGLSVLAIFFIPYFISEITTNFAQLHAVQKNLASQNSVLANIKWQVLSLNFINLLTQGLIPQSRIFSLFLFAFIVSFTTASIKYKKLLKDDNFTRSFVILTACLFLLSWLYFVTNSGWHSWHTVYLPPLIFTATLLAINYFPGVLRFSIFLLIVSAQFLVFKNQYLKNLHPSNDASLLGNEMKAVDWVYQKSNGRGFYVYSYLPSVYDYPYQYLFWWHGRKEYGYVPCEYTTYPGIPDFFVKGVEYYQEPKRECANIRYLIIEPDKNQDLQNIWLAGVQKNTSLIEETKMGKIRIEKRLIN